ncbi:MAG: DUF3460 family protein [Burkholderiales bacterium]
MAIDRNYVSETTQFLRHLLDEKPEIEEERRKGREIWWDHKQDPDEVRRRAQSRVKQKAYVYFSDT